MPRLTGYRDAANMFLWTSLINKSVGKNASVKILALISMDEKIDCIEIAAN
jgi:hypothetical protein